MCLPLGVRGARGCLPAALLALMLASACGPGAGERAPTASVPASAPAAAPPSAAGADLALPLAGQAHVELTPRGVTLRANAAPRLDLLRQLAEVAGFQLVLGELSQIADADAEQSVDLRDVSLADALVEILAGLSFRLEYRVTDADDRAVLRRVGVGALRPRLSLEERQARRAELRAERRSPEVLTDRKAELARRRQEAAAQRAERAALAPQQIADADPAVRAEGVAALDAGEAANFARLAELLRSDPSPEVRAAAARELASADSAATVGVLLAALRDPSSQVVVEAIQAIEFAGDESLVPQLEFLRQHPDSEVREAAEDAIQFLE